MIQPNELRIDNWVYNSTTKNNMQVYPMMIPQLYRIEKEHGSLKDSNIKPIPLTEEILLGCGLKQENGVMSYVLDDYSDIKIVYETLAGYYRLYPYTYEIKYLHQLQNLFYCLCGFELEVSL